MTVERDLGGGLIARASNDALHVVLPNAAPSLRFARVGHYVSVSLQLAGGRIGADVTIQPGVVTRQLDQTARELAVDPNRWRMGVLTALREWSGELDWCPTEPGALLAAVGALGHPLLHHVYRRGHQAVGEMPRWAIRVLRARDLSAAATTLDPRANRRLVSSLATSLTSQPAPAEVEFGPLAFAIIGAALISVDELSNVLDANLPNCAERAHEAPTRLPTSEQIRDARQTLELWPAARRAALLVDVAAKTDAIAFAEVLRQLWWIRDRIPPPLPVRWGDLGELRTRLVPHISHSRPAMVPARPRPATTPAAHDRQIARPAEPALPRTAVALTSDQRVPAETAQLLGERRATRPRAAFEQPRRAPVTGLRMVPSAAWSVQEQLQTIHHSIIDDIRFVVPTSLAELRHWGRVLHNCIGDFGPAIVAGRSWLIGIERGDALVGCVEISPQSGSIVQLLGARNRPLAEPIVLTVTQCLRALGLTAIR